MDWSGDGARQHEGHPQGARLPDGAAAGVLDDGAQRAQVAVIVRAPDYQTRYQNRRLKALGIATISSSSFFTYSESSRLPCQFRGLRLSRVDVCRILRVKLSRKMAELRENIRYAQRRSDGLEDP